jgi:hypothetical protein
VAACPPTEMGVHVYVSVYGSHPLSPSRPRLPSHGVLFS